MIESHTVQEYMQPELPNELPGVRKYSRVKFQAKQDYIPITTDSKYAVAVSQLEDHGSLHPDAHMLFMQTQEEHTYFIMLE